MAVLTGAAWAAAALTLAGCYEPSLRDCTVRCGSAGDCAAGHVCGSDGLCASPEVAGHCAEGSPDPGAPSDAAASAPPDAAVDAPMLVNLHVMIAGQGSVVVDGQGTCSSGEPQRGDCTFQIAPRVAQAVHAVMTQLDMAFTDWTSPTCHNQGATCVFTPAGPTTLSARFDKIGGKGKLGAEGMIDVRPR